MWMPIPTTSPGCDRGGIERFERLIDEDGVAIGARRGSREHEQPARRDDGDAERHVAGIDQVNSHPTLLGIGGNRLPREQLRHGRSKTRDAQTIVISTRGAESTAQLPQLSVGHVLVLEQAEHQRARRIVEKAIEHVTDGALPRARLRRRGRRRQTPARPCDGTRTPSAPESASSSARCCKRGDWRRQRHRQPRQRWTVPAATARASASIRRQSVSRMVFAPRGLAPRCRSTLIRIN